ncbi:MAG: hypothetical protein KDK36_16085 [Leptospiraceae bacterium]|nr:hypothetical protein [Leptospiraceae bacterium]
MNSESSDYHLELIYKYNTNIDLIFFYMTMITTFLIPYYGNMDLSLEIELENTKTKGKWKSNYEVFQRVWIHPLLILTAPFLNPITIREKAMKNLNYKIISDLEKSGVIK